MIDRKKKEEKKTFTQLSPYKQHFKMVIARIKTGNEACPPKEATKSQNGRRQLRRRGPEHPGSM